MKLSEKIWDTSHIDHYEKCVKYIKREYNKSIKALETQTNGKLSGSISMEHDIGNNSDTTILKLNISYNGNSPPFCFIKTYVKYNGFKNNIRLSHIGTNGDIEVKINDKKDFKDSFYGILSMGSTGNTISHLLFLNKSKIPNNLV